MSHEDFEAPIPHSEEIGRQSSFINSLERRPRGRWLLEHLAGIKAWWDAESEWTEPASAPEGRGYWSEEETRQFYNTMDRSLKKDLGIDETVQFSPQTYAQYRLVQADWTTVEIGPGDSPSGLNRSFKNLGCYLGIENFSFEDYSETAVRDFERIRSKRIGENILLLEDRLFGYKTKQYSLPDEVANEIYVNRVYDKPSWAYTDNGDQQYMTDEIERLLKPNGYVLVGDLTRNIGRIGMHLQASSLKIVYASWMREWDWKSEAKFRKTKQGQIMERLGFSFCAPLLLIAQKQSKQSEI